MGRPDRIVRFCMDRVRMLRHFGLVLYVVFDGARLPMKEMVEVSRQRSRAPVIE
jgi:exonuclease-1